MTVQSFGLGIAGGIVGGQIAPFLRMWFDHVLDQQKQRAAEERAIRAEQREEARKEKERQEVEAARLKQDEGHLLALKTKMTGTKDPFVAAATLNLIHQFFDQRPHYIGTAQNRRFLEDNPGEHTATEEYEIERRFDYLVIMELQNEVEGLRLS